MFWFNTFRQKRNILQRLKKYENYYSDFQAETLYLHLYLQTVTNLMPHKSHPIVLMTRLYLSIEHSKNSKLTEMSRKFRSFRRQKSFCSKTLLHCSFCWALSVCQCTLKGVLITELVRSTCIQITGSVLLVVQLYVFFLISSQLTMDMAFHEVSVNPLAS